ncbi:hypothetical protein [uncultured Porphyromonas sp.]|uniref:hypothetical protein n=1 Tax=uncultured Porphyromonas sp. TaxID=159274 RepID=UPI002627DC3A|nr:hypothetical protein [uncultured Porphyromonas sp.]
MPAKLPNYFVANSLPSPATLMAYRRPLTPTQMVIISALWLALVLWILFGGARLNGPTLLTLLLSGVIVFYPIVKSWRQRQR